MSNKNSKEHPDPKCEGDYTEGKNVENRMREPENQKNEQTHSIDDNKAKTENCEGLEESASDTTLPQQGNEYEEPLKERKDNEILRENLCDKNNNEVETLKSRILQLEDQVRELKNSELYKENQNLKNENIELQGYIGNATTFSLSDSDKNHSSQFVKDIENLQSALDKYVGNLKPKVDVNLDKVNELLRHYKCEERAKSKKESSLLIKGALQGYVIDTIIRLKLSSRLENDILGKKDALLNSLDELSKLCDGSNEITKAYPIKIRQQIYGFLGDIGFDISENKEHPFISNIKNMLNKSMNEFRTIEESEKRKKHDNMAANLIREAIRIFFFRLYVQEPVVEYRWFNYGDKIDSNLMEWRWGDEDVDNIFDAVELCYFPLLCANYNTEGQKIYKRAKVIPRKLN